MTKLNEWGLAEQPQHQGLAATPTTSTPMSPTADAAIGAAIGAVAGGVAGRVMGRKKSHTMLGAGVGAVAGGVGGYMYGQKQQTTAAARQPVVVQVNLQAPSAAGQQPPAQATGMFVGDTLNIVAPSGGQVTNVTGPSSIVGGVVASGQFTGKATAAGSTPLSVAWSDAAGNQYTSTVTVTVS